MKTLKPLILLLTRLGLPLGAATALAILLLEKNPLCLSDLAKKTGYTKSHLSIYLRTLASRKLVEIRRIGRRIYYRASNNALAKLLHEHLESIHSTLEYLKNTVGTSDELNHFTKELDRLIKSLKINKRAEERINI